jgi:hypothetical protein
LTLRFQTFREVPVIGEGGQVSPFPGAKQPQKKVSSKAAWSIVTVVGGALIYSGAKALQGLIDEGLNLTGVGTFVSGIITGATTATVGFAFLTWVHNNYAPAVLLSAWWVTLLNFSKMRYLYERQPRGKKQPSHSTP